MLHKELKKLNNQKVDILNAPHLGSFPPYYKTPFVPSYKSEEERIHSFSYLNISYVKRWDIKRRMRCEMFRWCEQTEGEKMIFFYNFTALTVLPELKQLLTTCQSGEMKAICEQLDTLEDVYALIDASIDDNPPFSVREGGMIKDGYNKDFNKDYNKD